MVEIIKGVHSIEKLGYPVPNVGFISYIVEEKENNLTLIDTCFRSELPKLEEYIINAGYQLKHIRRLILTHVHPDHIQATNELRKKVAEDVKSMHIGLKLHIYLKILHIVVLHHTNKLKNYFKSLEPKWKIWPRDLDQFGYIAVSYFSILSVTSDVRNIMQCNFFSHPHLSIDSSLIFQASSRREGVGHHSAGSPQTPHSELEYNNNIS